ncbi:hypothetical protein FRC12_002621 [Ceratobasidium sp. 428]|nr:hypothetical protein FRC12_002621 [Ceratobasidium sp. 428]
MDSVFSEKRISASGSGAFKASRLEEELKKLVRGATGDENTLMMKTRYDEEDCKVMVFAMSQHNMNASTPRIFRSYRGLSNQMPNCPIWQVLRATMAHPELFKSFEIGEASGLPESLVGGDVGCSNPTAHVLAEFSTLYPESRVASIVCIGTGHARTIQIPRSNILDQIMPTNVLMAMKNIATDSERVAQEMVVRFQDTTGVYFRFSVDQGMQDMRTGGWQRKNEVVAHTRAYTYKAEVTEQIGQAAQAIVTRRGAIRGASISGKVQQLQVTQMTGVMRCPAPSPAFTGFERHLSQVRDCLLSPANERRVCVVHGLGGSGKTQIALKVVEQTRENWSDIVYVDATTRETAISTLKGFALARKIGETHEDTLQWLELSSKSWLLVFDNADDPDLGIQSFIPGGSYGSVLITTRLRSVAVLGQGPGSECRIGGMEAEEAVELLLTKARMRDQELSGEETDAATKLVQDLGFLALAIVHAGAYIFCANISIAKYRKQCLEHTRPSLEHYSKLAGNVEQYEKTVYTTWVMSFKRLKPHTRQLLGLMAYLYHGGITEEIFERAANNMDWTPTIPPSDEELTTRKYVQEHLALYLDTDGEWDSSAFSAAISELTLYSLIDYDRVNEVYTLHVLVQDWARTSSTCSKAAGLMHASHILALSIDNSNDIEAHTYRRGLLLHVVNLDKLDSSNANDASFLAKVYHENGLWDEEEALQVQGLDAMKQALGGLHPDTLISMNNLAETYQNQGRWDEAEALQAQALDARKQALGDLHPDTLTSMANLAITYSDQGRWDEAEALRVQVLDARKQALGDLHPSTLTSMHNLALTYWKQGRWDEAEALQVQVLDARKQVHRDLHPDTLTSMHNLAATYSKQGRWDEAEALQVHVLDASKQALGDLHPSTLTSMHNLAATYSKQGRWDEAEALRVQVLDARKQVLGDLHPSTLTSMHNLALTYWKQGRWDEAEALQVQVLDARKQVHRDLHPDTLTSMHNLAATYSKQGRWDEAEALQVHVLDASKQALGDLHPSTLTSMHNLAATYSKQGRWDEAEALRVQVLDARKQVLGDLHPSTLTSMHNLALTYWKQGRWDEAEALKVQVLDARKQALGDLHPNTLTSMANLAITYWKQGRWDEAEALLVQVLDAMKQVLGDLHPDTLTSMANLASTYRNQGRWDEAEALEVQVLDARKRVLGELHPSTLISMYNLASTYLKRGRPDEAEALQTRTVAANQRVFGDGHRETIDAMEVLVKIYEMQGPQRTNELEALKLLLKRLKAT